MRPRGKGCSRHPDVQVVLTTFHPNGCPASCGLTLDLSPFVIKGDGVACLAYPAYRCESCFHFGKDMKHHIKGHPLVTDSLDDLLTCYCDFASIRYLSSRSQDSTLGTCGTMILVYLSEIPKPLVMVYHR